MVAFLTSDSQYIQHLAGNILVSASSFLAQLGSKWVEFLRLLWISTEASVSSICSCTPSSSLVGFTICTDESLAHHRPHTKDDVSGTNGLILSFTSPIVLLRPRLAKKNLLMVEGLFRILRIILKSLRCYHSHLAEVFTHLAVTSLLKMPWVLLSEIHVSQSCTSELSSSIDNLADGEIGLTGSKDVLVGTILQLFCSLVEQKNSGDLGHASLEEFSIYSKFTDLVSIVLPCCFSKQLGSNDKRLSRYLSHKVLMLMLRLSFHKHWQHSRALLWLKVLREYFKDFLYECISECNEGFQNCLEGSPFLANIVGENKANYPCTQHLQRQSVLLLFRCCFTLSRNCKDTSQGCDCVVESSSFTCELQLCSELCCRIGLSDLSEWLQRCGFLEKISDYKNYAETCDRFALSFLQLYIEDDDMLFEMLLQLLDAPFFTLQTWSNAKDISSEELKNDFCLHLSSIFNPIHLFHMFLSLLHYDHLVLVDYLISKDTGVHCAQYLLRCLRKIFESWMVFVEFSLHGSEISHTCHKRRKIGMDEEDRGRISRPSSVLSEVVNGQKSRSHESVSVNKSLNLRNYANSKECLLSLKRSVEDLHQKKLFPYNPGPLLRSFSRFQELCEKQ